MDVFESLEKLKKRYPEDKDIQAVESYLKSPAEGDDTLLLAKVKQMIDRGIAEHECRKNHGYYYHHWNYPYVTWTSTESSGPTKTPVSSGDYFISNNKSTTGSSFRISL